MMNALRDSDLPAWRRLEFISLQEIRQLELNGWTDIHRIPGRLHAQKQSDPGGEHKNQGIDPVRDNPETSYEPSLLTPESRAAHERFLKRIINELESMLDSLGIDAALSGRVKSNRSIWRKMQRKGVPLDNIFDLRGIRIMVAETNTCYHVLDLIHRRWQPIVDEFDDYIATPKENTYQSLHTTVITEDGKPLEVQIRTFAMHENAENGAASHQHYKEECGCR